MALDGDREREGIAGGGGEGSGGVAVATAADAWAEALGDDGRELLELVDGAREGYKLNLMLTCFLTDRPRSGATGAPSTMLAAAVVASLSLSLSRPSLACGNPGSDVDQLRGRGRKAGGWRRQRWMERDRSALGWMETSGRALASALASTAMP